MADQQKGSQKKGKGGGSDKGGKGGKGGGGGGGQKEKSGNKGKGKGGGNNDNAKKNTGGDRRNKGDSKAKLKAKQEAEAAEALRVAQEKERKEQEERDRKAAAAEKARLEAEAKRKAEILARQAEVRQFVEDLEVMKKLRSERCAMCGPGVVEASRQAHQNKKKSLKSDLKKAMAISGKVREMVSNQITGMIRDAETLNLFMYISEIVTAFCAPEMLAKIKLSDMPGVVSLICALHTRYEGFTEPLIQGLAACLDMEVKQASYVEDDTNSKAPMKRSALRLLSELYLCGVHDDFSMLLTCLRRAYRWNVPKRAQAAKEGIEPTAEQMDQTLIVNFAKSNFIAEFTGKMPTKARIMMDEYKAMKKEEGEEGGDDSGGTSNPMMPDESAMELNDRTSRESRAAVLSILEKSHHILHAALVSEHKSLGKLAKRYERDEMMHGALAEDKAARLTEAKASLERLWQNVAALAEALDVSPPSSRLAVVSVEDDSDEETGGEGLSLWQNGGRESSQQGPFGDDDSKAFYTSLPDLLASVPAKLLGLSEAEATSLKEKRLAEAKNEEEEPTEGGDGEELEVVEDGVGDKEEEEDDEDDEAAFGSFDAVEEMKESAGGASAAQKLLAVLTDELPLCHSKEKTDDLVRRFIDLQGAANKGFRKRLVQELIAVPRQRLDLLPQYARISASLSTVATSPAVSISAQLASLLRAEFRNLCRRKATAALRKDLMEVRLKNARYIAELTKFGSRFGAPPALALSSLKLCLEDFTGGNVNVACALLEGCGRYLVASKHTAAKAERILSIMMKLKSATSLDANKKVMIDNAFFSCKPQQGGVGSEKARRKAARLASTPPEEKYLTYLLMERLHSPPTPESVDFVLSKLRKLPWTKPKSTATVPSSPAPSDGSAVDAPENAEISDTKVAVAVREADIESELVRCCLKLRKLAWAGIPNVADMLSGLWEMRPNAVVRVVDALIEEVTRSLESQVYRDPQKQLACCRLLGELFGFNVIDIDTLFKLLYMILYHGHKIPSTQLRVKPLNMSPSEEIEAINLAAQESVQREKARAQFVASLKICHENQTKADEAKAKSEAAATSVINALAAIAAGGSEEDADSLAESLKTCEEEAAECEALFTAAVRVAEEGWASLGTPPQSPGELPLPWWSSHDPRVSFEGDPEDDVFRLRSVTVVLHSVADFFGPPSSMRRRMCTFLTHFQRYMLAKHSLPLASKYSVWDCLEVLEQKMRASDVKKLNNQLQADYDKSLKVFKANKAKSAEANPKGRGPRPPRPPKFITLEGVSSPFLRFDEWSKAQLAVEDIERKEAILEISKKLRQVNQVEASASERATVESSEKLDAGLSKDKPNGEGYDENDNEEDDDEEEDDEDDEEEEEDDEEDDEEDEEEEEEEEEDIAEGDVDSSLLEEEAEMEALVEDLELVHVKAKEKSPEDDEFERMLAKTMKETLESSRNSTSARVASQRGSSSLAAFQPSNSGQPAAQVQLENGMGTGVKFQMLRKGKQGRQETKSLVVPSSTSLASSYTAGQEERAKERELIKGVVLQYGREHDEREHLEEQARMRQRTFMLAGRGGIHQGKGYTPKREENEYASLPLHRLRQPAVPQGKGGRGLL